MFPILQLNNTVIECLIMSFTELIGFLIILGHKKSNTEIHSPYERILQRQFVNNLIVLAYHLYKKDHP